VKPTGKREDLAAAGGGASARHNAFKTNLIWPGDPGRARSRRADSGRKPHDQVARVTS